MRFHTFESFNEAKDLFSKTELKIMDLNDELKDLKSDLKQAKIDMEGDPEIEIEGGPVANEWGKKIMDLEDQIEKTKAKIQKLETPRKPGVKKELTYEEAINKDKIKAKKTAKSYIEKEKEDILRSMKSYPNRSYTEQAIIYKKRYNIPGDLEYIEDILKELNWKMKI